MKKPGIWIVRAFQTMVVIVALTSLGWYLFLGQPIARSDVPVTSDLGWWPYQNTLDLQEFHAEAINPRLNLFSHQFLIRFHFKGIIHTIAAPGWQPKIDEVQLTARVTSRATYTLIKRAFIPSVAEVLLVPVVNEDSVSSYKGEDIPFDFTIEHVFSTMDWGENRYECTCDSKKVSVTVEQGK